MACLCFSAGKFAKLLKPQLAELSLAYVKIAAYIADLITLACSFDICHHDSKTTEKKRKISNLEICLH